MKVTTNARQPLPGMSLLVPQFTLVTLAPEEVDKVFMRRLSDIIGGHFMRDGFLWRIDESRGRDWEERVAPIDPGHGYEPVIQALRLRAALIEAAL